ncbi:lysophospholipid acyltransferase family protein [uncultured Nocardioides sp.]|uniref:Acyltransferase family protein n=1 Tax=uncultured Nocardioides sp. TaxID=198441 RepID=A0A6J4P0K6_9ACTN|nr:lysophospholipid acyltransferase family protein [uncultured Nocardioides sp.]CAA9402864.1 MAG: Acyltransferase family protein [uncultured Nocardioides sp.]
MPDSRPGPEPANEPEQGADVIPIGTSGRPGRGSGRARPSESARNLAGPRRTPRSKPPASPGPPPADAPVEPVETPVEPSPEPPAATSSTSAADRDPTAGIPAGDWLDAFKQAAMELFDDDWERRLAEFLAFLRRRLEGGYAVDEYGFDQEMTERFFLAALRPIAEKWFRIEVRGVENIPAEGGALIVSNHSGTVPVDGLMTMAVVHDRTGRFLRPLAADLIFRLPAVSSLARRSGATLACSEDAERMLRGGELVGVWPEGFKGIGKPFSERYKLQRFGRGGFVSAALRTGVPIVPLSVVGAEEIYPLVGNLPSLARLLGVPYIPITPLFPWLGPLGLVPLPSKWLVEFGEPIRTDAYDPAEAEDPMLVFNVTDQVRETIQQTLYALLRERGPVFG